MDTFFSHIEYDAAHNIIQQTLLIDHLREVAEATQSYIHCVPDSIESKTFLGDLAFWIGVAHDFGKYTTYFQKYLLDGVDSGVAKNHSFISALWGAFMVHSVNELDPDLRREGMLLAFGCILFHHGHLNRFDDWLADIVRYRRPDRRQTLTPQRKNVLDTLVHRQLPDLLEHADLIEAELRGLGGPLPSLLDFKLALDGEVDDFYETLARLRFDLEDWRSEREYASFNYRLYLLFSALIDADKRDAAQVLKMHRRLQIEPSVVARYRKRADFGRTDPDILDVRNTLFYEVEARVNTLAAGQRILTLTAPTGSGKTLAVLNFAIKLRDRIQKEQGYLPRIIYALPFTSIIDQNHGVFEDVLSSLEGFEDASTAYLLKHHHLGNLEYKTKELSQDSYPVDKALMLIEGWESEIVVTTFVQLFHSIVSNRNRFLKKYHNIVGSILVLDEVQNIPVEYWPLVREVLRWLAEKAQCHVVLMTATQPLIFLEKDAFELVPQPTRHFHRLNRIKFKIDLSPCRLDTFVDNFRDELAGDKSYAVILNTIRSSIDFYEELVSDPSEHHACFYLSTNIIPKHRRKRIEQIRKKLKEGEPVILVTTHVIEAGVDLDFDVVFRDLAPIDSLIQAAGRANRHGKKESGEVNIVCLRNQDDRQFARWVYGKAHLFVAEELLRDASHLEEHDFYDLVKKNYRELVKRTDQAAGETIFTEWWLAGNYDALLEFRLVNERMDYVDVFISVDAEAEEVWRSYVTNILNERDLVKRKRNFLALRTDLRQYVISVPLRITKRHFWDYCLGERRGLGYLAPYLFEDYYELATGYKRTTDDEVMIF